jgi:hypothetical protein
MLMKKPFVDITINVVHLLNPSFIAENRDNGFLGQGYFPLPKLPYSSFISG